jgi:hypothetical protein
MHTDLGPETDARSVERKQLTLGQRVAVAHEDDEDEDGDGPSEIQIPPPTFNKKMPIKKLGKEMDRWFKKCLGNLTSMMFFLSG